MQVAGERRQDLRPQCDWLPRVSLCHEIYASLCQTFPLTLFDRPVPYTLSLSLPVTTTLLGLVPLPLLSLPPCENQIRVIVLSRLISAINRTLGVVNTM